MADVTKVHYRSRNGRLVFEIQGGSAKDLFAGIARVQDVFESDDKCGCCESENIRFNVRNVSKGKSEYVYFELRCLDCWAQLQFGQNQDMKGLFPKRKDENGNWMKNRGWFKYNGGDQQKDDTADQWPA